MTTTIIAIILAIFLGMAIMSTVILFYRSDNLLCKNKSLHQQIKSYREVSNDPCATYSVKRVATSDPKYIKYNGMWGVCRISCVNGHYYMQTIKVFTTENDEVNRNAAEVLCENLKEEFV